MCDFLLNIREIVILAPIRCGSTDNEWKTSSQNGNIIGFVFTSRILKMDSVFFDENG